MLDYILETERRMEHSVKWKHWAGNCGHQRGLWTWHMTLPTWFYEDDFSPGKSPGLFLKTPAWCLWKMYILWLDIFVVVVELLSHVQVCTPMDCNTPGFSVFHYLLELAQTHVHCREGNVKLVQYSCLENPMDGGAWWAAVHGVAKCQTWQRLHFHFSLICIGEGNGNPLQCSCLENLRDGGAWWAAVYGVSWSQTRLKQLSRAATRLSTETLMLLNYGVGEDSWESLGLQEGPTSLS